MKRVNFRNFAKITAPHTRILHANVGSVLVAVFMGLSLPGQAQADFRVRTAVPTSDTPFYGIVPDNITAAEALFLPQNRATISGYTNYPVINFDGKGTDLGQFLNGNPFPNNLNSSDYFAMEAIGNIAFLSSGNYTFRVNSDDGFRLYTDTNPDGSGGYAYSEFDNPRGPDNTDGPARFFTAGSFINIRLTYFQQAGGNEVEFSWSQDGSPFALTTGQIGIPNATPDVPEPSYSVFALLTMSVTAKCWIMKRKRRQ